MSRLRNNLFSILLAAIPVMGFSMSAGAKESELYSVTVTNATQGETYAAYKIFDVDAVNGTTGQREYTICDKSAWYGLVSSEDDIFCMTPVGDGTIKAVTLKEGVTARDAAMLFIKEGIPKDAVPDAFTEVLTNTGEDKSDTDYVRLELTEKGVYYINTQNGSLVLINGAYDDISIHEKKLPPAEKITYSFGIRKTGNAFLLDGAVFRLYRSPEDAAANENALYFTVDEAGKQYTVCETSDCTAKDEITCDIDAGWVYINSPTPGSYYLSEISAPGGYQKNPSVFQVAIEEDGTVFWREDGSGDELEEAVDGILMIENKAMQWMPGTGGIGRWPFYAVGLAFICLAVTGLLKKRSHLP